MRETVMSKSYIIKKPLPKRSRYKFHGDYSQHVQYTKATVTGYSDVTNYGRGYYNNSGRNYHHSKYTRYANAYFPHNDLVTELDFNDFKYGVYKMPWFDNPRWDTSLSTPTLGQTPGDPTVDVSWRQTTTPKVTSDAIVLADYLQDIHAGAMAVYNTKNDSGSPPHAGTLTPPVDHVPSDGEYTAASTINYYIHLINRYSWPEIVPYDGSPPYTYHIGHTVGSYNKLTDIGTPYTAADYILQKYELENIAVALQNVSRYQNYLNYSRHGYGVYSRGTATWTDYGNYSRWGHYRRVQHTRYANTITQYSRNAYVKNVYTKYWYE
jgi:hypothetical protein